MKLGAKVNSNSEKSSISSGTQDRQGRGVVVPVTVRGGGFVVPLLVASSFLGIGPGLLPRPAAAHMHADMVTTRSNVGASKSGSGVDTVDGDGVHGHLLPPILPLRNDSETMSKLSCRVSLPYSYSARGGEAPELSMGPREAKRCAVHDPYAVEDYLEFDLGDLGGCMCSRQLDQEMAAAGGLGEAESAYEGPFV